MNFVQTIFAHETTNFGENAIKILFLFPMDESKRIGDSNKESKIMKWTYLFSFRIIKKKVSSQC